MCIRKATGTHVLHTDDSGMPAAERISWPGTSRVFILMWLLVFLGLGIGSRLCWDGLLWGKKEMDGKYFIFGARRWSDSGLTVWGFLEAGVSWEYILLQYHLRHWIGGFKGEKMKCANGSRVCRQNDLLLSRLSEPWDFRFTCVHLRFGKSEEQTVEGQLTLTLFPNTAGITQ